MSKKEQRLNSPDPDAQHLDMQRRDFLRGSLVAATGVAISAASGSAVTSVAETKVARAPDKKDGYRLTQHISDYYKSAAI